MSDIREDLKNLKNDVHIIKSCIRKVPALRELEIQRFTTAEPGVVEAGKQSVHIKNVGSEDATVLGEPLNPGEDISLEAYYDPITEQFLRVPEITYVASATGILRIKTID